MPRHDYIALKDVDLPGVAAVWDSLAATCDAKVMHRGKTPFRIRSATPLERMVHGVEDDERVFVMLACRDPQTIIRWAVPVAWLRWLPRQHGHPDPRACYGKVLAAERAGIELTRWKVIGNGEFFQRVST